MAVFALVGPLYRRVQRQIEQDAPPGLSVGVRAVLALLHEHGPMTVPHMGREQSISRQFVQRMVNDAATDGLVEAVPNPAHARSSLIRLTGAGHTTIEGVLAREHALLREAADDLTVADVDACVRVLSRMLTLFEDSDGPA
ncbi:MarR family transcriptional regulator [Streptomyces sp. NPDC051597]|uniref:MarR family winged helix-turn-helix transcriptional regulator n=1 Tax=Streptomyces sp. NPDC051597 TaxID=3155049 RepID=UPI00343DAD51